MEAKKMGEKVELFGCWASRFSFRVELALKLKGIEYNFHDEDLQNKSDLLLKYNPVHKMVPVLLHHGKPIPESLVILEYIEEMWKSEYPILPENPHERAAVRFWAKFIDDKFTPALLRAVKSEGEEREKAVEEGLEALEWLENELKDKRFFGGERIGFLDIAATTVAYWVPALEEGFGIELLMRTDKFPELKRWREELISHTVVSEILPPMDKLAFCLKLVFSQN